MARYHTFRSEMPMDNDTMALHAPSIFAAHPHASRSDRYAYVSTVDILNEMRKEGFQPFAVSQMGANKEGKEGFTKHMIRFAHADTPKSSEGRHEIILLNSHDGSSSFRIAAGFFRFVCCNGLWMGTKDFDVKVWHKGEAKDIIEGSFKVISQTKENHGLIESMMETDMPIDQRVAFANKAIASRFGDRGAIVTPDQVLSSRRDADNANTQWQVFNRVQENLMLGGMDGKSQRGKTRRVRSITGLDKDMAFNRALWNDMREVIAA